MSALVFYGGAGINIISYCCSDCRSAGVGAMLNDECCIIHNHSHNDKHSSDKTCSNHEEHKDDNCCDDKHQKPEESDDNHFICHHQCIDSEESCNMERINFDWTVQNITELEIDLSPRVLDILPIDFFNVTHTHLPLVCENNTVMPNGPPLVCPRDYLSTLTVLLI